MIRGTKQETKEELTNTLDIKKWQIKDGEEFRAVTSEELKTFIDLIADNCHGENHILKFTYPRK